MTDIPGTNSATCLGHRYVMYRYLLIHRSPEVTNCYFINLLKQQTSFKDFTKRGNNQSRRVAQHLNIRRHNILTRLYFQFFLLHVLAFYAKCKTNHTKKQNTHTKKKHAQNPPPPPQKTKQPKAKQKHNYNNFEQQIVFIRFYFYNESKRKAQIKNSLWTLKNKNKTEFEHYTQDLCYCKFCNVVEPVGSRNTFEQSGGLLLLGWVIGVMYSHRQEPRLSTLADAQLWESSSLGPPSFRRP